MAIFKSKHKKDQNSASNRADATGVPASPKQQQQQQQAGLDQSGSSLKGSYGRANGQQQLQQQQQQPGGGAGYVNGNPAGERLYASAGSANSSNLQYGAPPGQGFPPYEGGGYPGPMTTMRQPGPAGQQQQQQQQYPGVGGMGGIRDPTASTSSSTGMTPSSPSSSSNKNHTVLYPWSQRRVALLPSQHLAPLQPGDSASLASSPILGPTSPLPFPRYGHSVNPVATATPTGDLYIFGGLVQNSVRNDLYVVHASSASQAPSAIPQQQAQSGSGSAVSIALVETRGEVPGPRVGHASVGVGNVLIVWGGDTKTRPEERQDDGLYLLNLSTRDWTRVKTVGRAPEGRYGHAVAMVGSRFFVFGGQTDDGGFKNDLCYFDLQKLKQGQPSWTFIEPQSGQIVPPARTGHTCVTFGDSLYIFGGTDGQYHYNDTWQYDLATGEWTELACIGYIPVPREGHAATLVDDVMYIFGGRGVDGKDLDDLAAFKISNHRWFMFQNMGPAPSGRSGHSMATHGSKVFVLGGESYTSGRVDDPSLVHILETTKIKYPPDSRPVPQQLVNSTSTPPQGSSSAGFPPQSGLGSPPMSPPPTQQLPPPIGTNMPVKRKTSIPAQMAALNGYGSSEELRNRAASPTGSQGERDRGLGSSLNALGPAASTSSGAGQLAPAAQITSSASAPAMTMPAPPPSGSKPPTRPARPDDADAFRSSPALGSAPMFSSPPVGSGRTRSPTVTNADYETRQRQASATSDLQQQPPVSPPMDAFYYRDPTAAAAAASTSAGAAPAQPATSTTGAAASNWAVPSEALEKLQREKAWLLLEVERLRSGQVREEAAADGADGGKGLEAAHVDASVREALLEMKSQLAAAQESLTQRIAEADERYQVAESSRRAALQEAAYARAKVAALESASPSELAKVERERVASLEQRLAEALEAQATLTEQVATLRGESEHHRNTRTSAEERCEAALARANEAEQNHARVLADLTALQTKADEHERAVAEHVEHNAHLTSTGQRLENENARLKSADEAHSSSVEQWLAAIAASEAALLAARKHNEEISTSRDSATRQLEEHQSRIADLESQAAKLRYERDAASARAEEAERMHATARELSDSNHALATGGLAQLLKLRPSAFSSSREGARSDGEGANRSLDDEVDATRPGARHLAILEEELGAVKGLHDESRAKQTALAAELAQAREREAGLHVQLSQARSQLAVVQKQHASVLDDLKMRDSRVQEHEAKAKEAGRARDAAEVKTGVLRNMLADHGLASPNDDDLAKKFSPMSGDESADQLAKRVKELEAELASRQHQRQQIEDRASEHGSEVARLQSELEQERSSSSDVRSRADKSQEELEALQGRHQQLEATHLKAVQYVKGTEKMLRRMKEELNRYKERCEQLDSPERQREVEQLRGQVDELKSAAETSAREVDQLKQHASSLQNQLNKAHTELEETLAVNASLNKELQSALKNPSSPRQGGSNQEYASLQAEYDQAQNRAEWLKRENASLEQRCRTAESKIAILLDHMEGIQNDHYEGGAPASADAASAGPHAAHDYNDHDWQEAEHHQRVASPSAMYASEEPQRRI